MADHAHAARLERRAGLPGRQQVLDHREELLLGRVPGLEQVVVERHLVDRRDRRLGVGVGGQQHPLGLGDDLARLHEVLACRACRACAGRRSASPPGRRGCAARAGRPSASAPERRAQDAEALAEAAAQVAGDRGQHRRLVVDREDRGAALARSPGSGLCCRAVRSAWADIALMTRRTSGDNRQLMAAAQTTPYTGRTAWARNLATPVRDFLSTETGGAIVLLGGGDRGADLGERAGRTPTNRCGRRALDPPRRRRDLGRPAPLGQRGPDDVLLPRRRARGQARARPRRAARAPAARDPGARGDRRHHRADRDLPRVQRRRRRRGRLGRGDVDRHRLRARRAGAAHAARRHPAARVPADARRRSTTSARCS